MLESCSAHPLTHCGIPGKCKPGRPLIASVTALGPGRVTLFFCWINKYSVPFQITANVEILPVPERNLKFNWDHCLHFPAQNAITEKLVAQPVIKKWNFRITVFFSVDILLYHSLWCGIHNAEFTCFFFVCTFFFFLNIPHLLLLLLQWCGCTDVCSIYTHSCGAHQHLPWSSCGAFWGVGGGAILFLLHAKSLHTCSPEMARLDHDLEIF